MSIFLHLPNDHFPNADQSVAVTLHECKVKPTKGKGRGRGMGAMHAPHLFKKLKKVPFSGLKCPI
jgi:hypothetical protein